MELEQRITELEMYVSHQEQTITELNQSILSQQEKIETLHSAFVRLEREWKNFSSSEAKDVSEEPPPPHY